MNRLRKIKNYFQREWIDFVIFGISVIAIISASIMVIQIKDIKSEIAEMKTEIVELAEEQDTLESLAIEQSERMNNFMSAYEESGNVVENYIYDIPLSEELQTYTYELCKAYDVEYETVLAIMQVESYFTNVVSAGGDYGLCQINKVNHEWLFKKYGLDNMLDKRQNIKACVVMLNDIQQNEYFDTPEKVLMAYNMGQGGAKKAIENGITETDYTIKIYKAKEELKGK